MNSRSEFVDGALPSRKVTVEFDGPAAEETHRGNLVWAARTPAVELQAPISDGERLR